MQTLSRVQRGLESLYRVDTGVEVNDFVVGHEVRDELAPSRRPKEQLLVCEEAGEMALALYIDPAVLANLAANDPARRLGDHNLGDFLYAVEGVSHFVYAVLCARHERPVTQLELELQAEVDKYVTCLLATEPHADVSEALRRRLFGDCAYEPDLDHDEHARYRAANDNALRYATYLEQTYVAPRRIPEMLGELRRFYRESLAGKLSRIARAA
ncbi:MAG TPA: hypothetical protein VFQ53_16680 [Kofleriaceae bacterium]|nr:hypothetical protein [Kofleriaceae bacterium]